MLFKTKRLPESRARRDGSSAPGPKEINIYRRYLVRAIHGSKHPRVLVLGATPELRDLAIGLKCETVAVDNSRAVLSIMQTVMKHANCDKDIFVLAKWQDIGKLFSPISFDAVLADVAVNNIGISDQFRLMADVKKLLRPGGLFINRHTVYLDKMPIQSVEYFYQQYKKGIINWLFFWWCAIGYYTKYQPKVYNPKNKCWLAKQAFSAVDKAIKNKEIKLTKADILKIKNLAAHADKVHHYTYPKSQWEKIARRYFNIVAVAPTFRWDYALSCPIYVYKKR